jgi:hypothetical protein
MKRWFSLIVILAVLIPIAVTATGPELPAKGTLCWDKSPATDLAGYEWYIVQVPGKPVTGIVTTGPISAAPAPPTPSQACPTGQIGVSRDQTGKPDGQYYAGVLAYDTAGNRGGSSEFAYTLNVQAPLPLTGLGAH